jgi:hypothetical protein
MPKIDKPTPVKKVLLKVVPVAKVPPKPLPKKLPEKVVAKPSKMPPKPISKVVAKNTPTKPINSLAVKLERAADLEGMWVKDFVTFPDLLKKYALPSTITFEQVEDGHALSRVKVRQTLLKFA